MQLQRTPQPVAAGNPAAGRWEVLGRNAIAGIAGILAVLAPLPIGCSDPWSRWAVEAVMAAFALLWAVFLCRSSRTMLWLLGCCGLAFLQLVPLPDGMLTAMAPISAGAWKVANVGSMTWGTISIDPAATAVGIRRILLWLAAANAIKDAASEPAGRRFLASSMAACAVVITGLALAFPVDAKHRLLLGCVDMNGPTAFWWQSGANLPVRSDGGGFLYWAPVEQQRYRYDEVLIGDGFGPYVTSNQCAGALCLTLPFLFAVVVIAARRLGQPAIAFVVNAGLMAGATWMLWELAGSRAGTAALLLAQAVFVTAIAPNSWTRRIAGVGAAAYGIILLVLIAGLVGLLPGLDQWVPQPLQAKITALLQDPRAVAANVARRMFLASTILGTGINSYAAVYSRFIGGDFTLYYAYNDYAQLLAETGLVGLAVAIAWASPMMMRIPRVAGVAEADKPIAAAAVAAIAGLAAHMALEWSLHQPANAFLACVAVGLFLAAVPRPVAQVHKPRPSRAWSSRITTGAFVAACGLAVAVLARDAVSDTAVRAFRVALVAARPAPEGSARPDPKPLLERAIERGARAASWDPRNATLELLAGQSLLHLAEFQSVQNRAATLSRAEVAFQNAQRRRAVGLGFPEPIPRARK